MAKKPTFDYNNSIRNKVQAEASKTLASQRFAENIKSHQAAAEGNQPQTSTQQAGTQFTPSRKPPFSIPELSPQFSGSLNAVAGAIAKDNHARMHASYTASRQFAGSLNGQQTTYSNINVNNPFGPNAQHSAFRMPTSLPSNYPLFTSSGIGTINGQQVINAARSAKEDRLADSIDKLRRVYEDLLKKSPPSTGGTAAGGGGGVGGGEGGGAGGAGEFLRNLGRKNRLGFRGGVAGQLLNAAGQIVNSGIDAYLNYQTQMATAPVETYANIANLKGFQQRRFLRDFSDFSPESQVLRNTSLRFDQTDITSRIDKIAKETTQKQDIAETQATMKQSLAGILGSVVKGAIMGAGTGAAIGAVTGPGALVTAGVGALTGGLASLASEFADSFDNPVSMRNQKTFGDLYLKNRTAFDTQNIMQNTQSMENAVIQNSQIDIAVQREYQKTIRPRVASSEQGRYYDVFGDYGSFVRTFLGHNTPRQHPLSTMDQSTQLKFMAADLYTPGQTNKNFAQVLTAMGRQVGTQEAESVMSQLSNIGGAGAGALKDTDFKSLEKLRQMSFSGRGSAESLLGQAGVLGRLSGGVSVEQNMKKLEEVLGRAVATGMDNSELGSAFVQNVTNMSAKMQSGDVGSIAALVQKMQTGAGGQLVDFQRMQQSMSGADRQRQENIGVKTMARENIANMLKGFTDSGKLTSEDALQALTIFPDITTEELQTLNPQMQKYLNAKTPQAKTSAYRGLSKTGKNLADTFGQDPEKLKLLTSKEAVKGYKNAFGAAAVIKDVASFRDEYGLDPLKAMFDPQTATAVARKANLVAGGSSTQYLDMIRLEYGKTSTANATDQKAVSETEKRVELLRKSAAAGGSTALGATNETTNYQKLLFMFRRHGTEHGREELLGSPEYKKIISKGKFTPEEEMMIPGVIENIHKGNTKNIDSNFLKKLETTTEGSQGPLDVTSVSDRPQGSVMSNQDAALLGSAFADAFFKQMKGEGSAPASSTSIPANSTNKNDEIWSFFSKLPGMRELNER